MKSFTSKAWLLAAVSIGALGFVSWLPTAHYGTFSPCPSVTVPGDTCNGSRPNRSPKISAAAGIDYTIHSGIGSFIPSVSVNYSSSFPWVPKPTLQTTPVFSEDAYAVVNASPAWKSESGHFNASVWAKNLTNTKYDAFGAHDGFGNFAILAAPRTFGGSVGFKF